MTRLSASIRKLQRALMTTVFNGAGEGSAKASWVLMRRTRADTFRSANRRKNLHRFSMLHVAEPKNRTCIGPHPRTPKKPTISVVERGYVRRSEVSSSRGNAPSDQLAPDGRLPGTAAPTLDTQGRE